MPMCQCANWLRCHGTSVIVSSVLTFAGHYPYAPYAAFVRDFCTVHKNGGMSLHPQMPMNKLIARKGESGEGGEIDSDIPPLCGGNMSVCVNHPYCYHTKC